jgi:hypothetical protein
VAVRLLDGELHENMGLASHSLMFFGLSAVRPATAVASTGSPEPILSWRTLRHGSSTQRQIPNLKK